MVFMALGAALIRVKMSSCGQWNWEMNSLPILFNGVSLNYLWMLVKLSGLRLCF
jgi:hypothetical protein